MGITSLYSYTGSLVLIWQSQAGPGTLQVGAMGHAIAEQGQVLLCLTFFVMVFSAGSFPFLLASSDLRNKTKCLVLNPTLQKIINQTHYTQTRKAGASGTPS